MDKWEEAVCYMMVEQIGGGGFRVDYRACIQRSIDHIEDHLQAEIAVGELAMLAGFSVYHYCRVFQYAVGVPVMEYVRRRRLAYAAAELVAGRRVLDVAVDFGFGTHSGFTKAFRKIYSLPPEQYRRFGTGYIPAKANLEQLANYNILGGVIMQPRIVFKPACKVAGFELRTLNGDCTNEIPSFWDRYAAENWCEVLHCQVSPGSSADLGICFPQDVETGSFSYVIGVEVDSYDRVPEGMFRGEIPAATYAVFTTPPADRADYGFTRAIQGAWRYIWNDWFPESGYEYASGAVDFELYDQRSAGDHDLVMEIHVPIQKKN